MAKKGRKASTAGQNRWEAALMQCPFEEESWKPNIHFVIENDRLDEAHVRALANAVKIPQRRYFSILLKQDLMHMVDEFGNPKAKKPAKVPQFYEITEVIYALLNAGQEIPLPLWAKLIKFGLINIKAEDQRKREGTAADKDKTAKGSAKKRGRSKSPGGKKGKKTPEAQAPKKDWSTMKKRGEEDLDNKYIDDEPKNGPQHYIFISGFRKPQLLQILDEMGIHVDGVMRLQSESYEILRNVENEKIAEEEPDEETLAKLKVKQETDTRELALFWKLLPKILENSPAASRLHDCALFEHTVRDVLYPGDWDSQENLIGYGGAIFEDVATRIYDALDSHRQYANYLTNINLIHIPEFGKEEKPSVVEDRATPVPVTTSQQASNLGKRDKAKAPDPPQLAEDVVPPISPPPKVVDTRYYQDLMNSVPMESVSVSLMLHCMLEQVVATEEDKVPPTEREVPARSDGIHLALADCIAESLEGLCLSEEDEQVLACDFPQFKQKREETREQNRIPQGPVLLHYGDDISVRTHHLKAFDGFNPKESELTLLTRFPSAKLLANESMTVQEAYERVSRLHELHRYTTTAGKDGAKIDAIAEKDVDRALELFVFESMNVAGVDESGNLLRRVEEESGNAWDDPYIQAARILVDEALLTAQSEEEKLTLRSFDTVLVEPDKQLKYFSRQRFLTDYIYSETFKTPVLLQMLEEARNSYPCMDTYHSKRDNSTYVMFHNPMADNYQCRSNWTTCLHSDVGFRNYMEHVADRISGWTQAEEQKYHAQQLALELEKLAQQAAEQQSPPPTAKRPKSGKGSKKGSRKGSPGRKGSPSRSSSKLGSSEPAFSSPYIRHGSLKGDNELMAKAKEEEERQKKEKEEKQKSRKSPQKEKGRKSATSRSSKPVTPTGRDSSIRRKSGKKSPKSRSRSNSGTAPPTTQDSALLEPQVPELPFVGYDVGNSLLHVHGDTSYLYPCDGGTIKVEKIRYEHGQVFVKATMYKDGHTFALHVLEPMDPQDEAELTALLSGPPEKDAADSIPEKTETTEEADKQSEPTQGEVTERLTSADLLQGKKEGDQTYHSLFSSWCAHLCDGMTLSFSKNGPDGINTNAVKAKERLMKILNDIPPANSPTPAPPGADSPKKGKKSPKGGRSPKSKSPRAKSPKGKKNKDTAEKEAEAQRLEELKLQEELDKRLQEAREAEELEKKRRKKPKFQHIYLSCPDGLAIRFELDPSSHVEKPDAYMDEYRLLVRQSYPYKTTGKQDTEKARSKPAMEEVSRVLMHDGRVIKIMKDGSTKVLFSDGTVCFNSGSGPLVTEQRVPATPASAHSGGSHTQGQPVTEEVRVANSAGSKKGSKGRKSSGKTLEASVTETSTAGTLGVAAGLEAEAGAKLEADMEKADSWVTTYMSGDVTLTKPNGTVVNQDPLLCYTATDPVTGEVMISREDKVVRVDRPDGSCVCDHTDGTRITRYYKEEEPEEQVIPTPAEDGEQQPKQMGYVRIECPGFATVTFNEQDCSCAATFGSGSTITCSAEGTYQLLHWNGGRLDISNDCSVMYTPRPNNDLLIAALSNAENGETDAGKLEAAKPDSIGSYLMCHHADVCCEALDQEGNVFQVKSSGDVNVITSESINHTGEEEVEEEVPPVKVEASEHHPPRLFVIHNDGTGTELLRYKDVQEYIGDANLDPITALIREPLPENMKVTGITVMRPHFGNSGDAWVLQKEEQDIVPANLKTRDLLKYPQSFTDSKKPGPPFGTTAGKGLAIGSAPAPMVPPPAPMCPHALELRQLLQYEAISQEMRNHLTDKVLEYGQAVCEQEELREKMQVHEPRTTEEQMRARDLLQLVLEFDENATPRTPDAGPVPTAILDQHASLHKFPALVPDQQDSPTVKVKYEAAVAPPPPPAPPTPKPKLTAEDWERIKRELEEERFGREALKNRDVPPYFNSEQGRAWLLSQAPNMKAAHAQMIRDPRKDGTEARMYDPPQQQEDSERLDGTSPNHDVGADSNVSLQASHAGFVSETPSKTRPTNPTPGHASGGGTPTKVRPDNPTPLAAEAQQRGVRPNNPTPSHAYRGSAYAKYEVGSNHNLQYQPSPIPENPTSAQKRESNQTSASDNIPPKMFTDFSNNNSSSLIPIDTDSDLILTKSLVYDVTGKLRKDRVRLPNSILSDKPGAVPNQKFMKVEDEVRRKVKTSSVAGGMMQGYQKVAERGFQVLPPEVVFGVLREGHTYSYTVKLRNTGVDSCRFKIKQPPPGTGLKIHYTPGSVAAGMERKIDIELYAIAVGVEGDSGVGTIYYEMEITGESELLLLPIQALVLTAHDYDNRTDSMPPGGKAPGVKVCSTKPPLRNGIVRPHKLSVEE